MTENKQEKISIGSQVGIKTHCSSCKKEGTSDVFITLQNSQGEDIYFCKECKEKVNMAFENETKNPNYILAVAAGCAGAVIGGIVWYYVAIMSGMEIGYISLGLGYLVGFGVHIGSGKKRGHQLQILSALLTLAAIIVTEKFIFQYFVNDYLQNNLAELPEYSAGDYISISFFDPVFWEGFFSPISLLIYAIGIFFAYKICKPRKI